MGWHTGSACKKPKNIKTLTGRTREGPPLENIQVSSRLANPGSGKEKGGDQAVTALQEARNNVTAPAADPQPEICATCWWALPATESYLTPHPELDRLCARVPTFAPELGPFPVEMWFSCHGWRARDE